MRKVLTTITILFAAILLVACNNNNENDKFSVVASTTMLGDLVRQIGGEEVSVNQLFGPGIDPHLATPTASDTNLIRNADLVVFNGLNLEGHFHQIINAYGDKVIEVAEIIERNELIEVEEGGNVTLDPHIWFSVPLWQKVTRIVSDEMQLKDPLNSEHYETNTISYLEELEELHNWIISETTTKLTKEQRVLVTAHDAFNYLGFTYDFKVEAIGGMSTEADPTVEDINNIASVVIDNNVKTIFIESTVSKTTVDAVIAEVNRRGSTLSIGNELYSDALGINLDSEYINAFKTNINNIINGLK